MQVDIQLFGALRDYLPSEQRGKATVELSSGASVQDVLDMLEIERAVIVAINEEHDSDTSAQLEAGDKVLVFELAAGG
jgi:sulfur carrier protein ThiS